MLIVVCYYEVGEDAITAISVARLRLVTEDWLLDTR